MRKKSIPSCSFHNPVSSINHANLQGLTRMFKCDLCGKSFSSGNALGGHKSSHKKQKTHHHDAINKGTTINITWSLSSSSSSPHHDDNEKQEHSCCQICKKFFPSNKALHGHMRSHKRDGKKVIHPPPTTSSLEHNNDVDEDRFLLRASVLDLSKYFPQV
ncbi:C2H2 zinc finger protein [Trifolium pratense]|uniref:C2H2 zinc finger protein n=1 Tax=Trifolium pratense TaxID=57577 RepID=A0A2K3LXB1_TRIPR|nr:C2H2 zinc finger protein [Trifolium pratense]